MNLADGLPALAILAAVAFNAWRDYKSECRSSAALEGSRPAPGVGSATPRSDRRHGLRGEVRRLKEWQ